MDCLYWAKHAQTQERRAVYYAHYLEYRGLLVELRSNETTEPQNKKAKRSFKN
jgi:hypothetical protein